MNQLGKKLAVGTIAAGVLLGGGLLGAAQLQSVYAEDTAGTTAAPAPAAASAETKAQGFDGRGKGGHGKKGEAGSRMGGLSEAAAVIGIDEAALRTELQAGKTLAAIAQEKAGLSTADLVQKLTDAAEERPE